MIEQAFQCGPGQTTVGVLSVPNRTASVGLIVLNAGLVHRVGPSRLSVRLTRRAAELGLAAARFDHGGIGDSGIRRDRLSRLESTIVETLEVMDQMSAELGVERFVLIGLCSGAVTAFKAAQRDPRIVGACLLNSQGLELNEGWNTYVRNRGWVRHYLQNSLFSVDSWRRALTGGVQYKRIAQVFARSLTQKLRPPKEVLRVNEKLSEELAGIIERRVRLLFVHSAGDHSEDYFELLAKGSLQALQASGAMELATIERADHTFSLCVNQTDVLNAVEGWLTKSAWINTQPVLAQAAERETGEL